MSSDTQTLSNSLRAFMSSLIDYAGLFPPAKLPLDEAMTNFATYRQESNQWMLSRFIIPAKQLDQISTDMLKTASREHPFRFSILGRGGATLDEFLSNLQADIDAVLAFQDTFNNRVVTDLFEVKLPSGLLDSRDDDGLKTLLAQSSELFTQIGTVTPFYEVPLSDNWQEQVTFAVNGIHTHNINTPKDRDAGYKLRCGGVTADLFPTPEQVAFAIVTCHEKGVVMKATAGLHHPIRHFSTDVNTTMHGFFNVFGAGLLAKTFNMPAKMLIDIITDEDAGNFTFTDAYFQWKTWKVSTQDLRRARQTLIMSYGSCSFDEPREDLESLGLM